MYNEDKVSSLKHDIREHINYKWENYKMRKIQQTSIG